MVSFIYFALGIIIIRYFFFIISSVHSCTIHVLTAKSFHILWVKDLNLHRNISQEQQRIWTELLLFILLCVQKTDSSKMFLKHSCNSFNFGKILIAFNLWLCISVLSGIYPTLALYRNASCLKPLSKVVVKQISEFMKSGFKNWCFWISYLNHS